MDVLSWHDLGSIHTGSVQPAGLEVSIMGKRLKRSLSLLGIFLATMAAVASGTAMPGGRPVAGYARLLERPAPKAAAQESLVTDCLMEDARLRAQAGTGAIPSRQFEELRAFCREGAQLDSQGSGIASADISPWERATARERIREHYRQAKQDVAADPKDGQATAKR
jgi:hypothetical protein